MDRIKLYAIGQNKRGNLQLVIMFYNNSFYNYKK